MNRVLFSENAEGQLVYSKEVAPTAVIALDLSGKHLSDGVYYLQVWVEDRKQVKKSVKQ